jgi:HlyD family secretion protein
MIHRARTLVSRFARRRTKTASAAAIVLVSTAVVVVPRPPESSWPSATARQAAFVERLVEPGTISAARLMLYGSKIAGGPAKIAGIAREGTLVAPGDLLLRFDGTAYEQELARERATLEQAHADLRGAQEALRLDGLQAQADVELARQQIAFAESELADASDGAGRLALAEANAAAAEAEREVARARRNHEDLKPMLAEGFITQLELERAEQALRRAEEQHRLTVLKQRTLAEYGRPAALGRARADVNNAREGFAREREAAAARLSQHRAALALADAKVREVEARIRILDEKLAHTLVRAESSGIVVYRDLYFGSDRRKPQVGDEVWPNQPVIALPDSARLTVDTRIREVDLHKVSASQRVRVRVDAYPDLRLDADVELVGALAQQDDARAGAKFFPVSVRLLESDPRLRTGMTARVEIEVASIPSAVVVPAQAVFGAADEANGRYCVVLRNGKPHVQPVTIAGDDGFQAAVGSGLAAGDVVLLVDPSRR